MEKLPPDRIIFVPKVYSTRLTERRYPTRQELDELPEIARRSLTTAMRQCSIRPRSGGWINRDTPQPAVGRILRIREWRAEWSDSRRPQLLVKVRNARPVTQKDRLWALKSMLSDYNSGGITSIIDRGQDNDGFRAYQTLRSSGELTVRSYVTYLIKAAGSPKDVRREIEGIPMITGLGDKWLRVGSLKTIIEAGS